MNYSSGRMGKCFCSCSFFYWISDLTNSKCHEYVWECYFLIREAHPIDKLRTFFSVTNCGDSHLTYWLGCRCPYCTRSRLCYEFWRI
nr:MAG TPA: hypothetical protein [Caudoviricetes sp.]DAQ56671.1 MAG TPA: hypothetical protein [Caudoviricetes sp.]